MKNYLAFEERFGPLSFLMSLDPHEAVFVKKQSIPSNMDLGQCDLLYIWDVAFCLDTEQLLEWLERSSHHVMHLIEPDIARWKGWLDQLDGEALIKHPRFFAEGMIGKSSSHLARDFARSYPSFYPLYIGEDSNKDFLLFKEEMQQSLLIYRNALARHVMWEELWDSMMSKRFLFKNGSNALDLEGRWKGKPAVICGGGPSLAAARPLLKELEDRAIFIGAGTGVASLDALDLDLDLACFCDATDLQYRKVSHFENKKIDLVYTPHVYPKVVSACGGRAWLFPLAANHIESFLWGKHADEADRWLGKDPAALSVTSLALSLAWHAGCSPIFLAGIDLAYLDDRRYSHFKEDQPLSDLIVIDERRLTAPHWLLEKKAIERFIASHPAEWITLSDGLTLEGCLRENQIEKYPKIDKQDLYPQESPSPWDDQKRDLLCESAQRIEQIIERYPFEAWPYLLEDEIVYQAFVEEGIFQKPVWLPLGLEDYFGEKAFVQRIKTLLKEKERAHL